MEYGDRGPRRDIGSREMYKAICNDAGRPCEVPFMPSHDQPSRKGSFESSWFVLQKFKGQHISDMPSGVYALAPNGAIKLISSDTNRKMLDLIGPAQKISLAIFDAPAKKRNVWCMAYVEGKVVLALPLRAISIPPALAVDGIRQAHPLELIRKVCAESKKVDVDGIPLPLITLKQLYQLAERLAVL